MEFFIVILIAFYFVLNLVVTKRINEANYSLEERRKLHKWFIWFVPFFGPFLIRGFWKKREDKLEVITKDQRKRKQSQRAGGYDTGGYV